MMKKLAFIFKIIIYYLIGLILFIVISTLTQMILFTIWGIESNLVTLLFNNLKYNFVMELIIYTILFAILALVLRIYDIVSTKKLNEKLKKIRRG